MPDGPLCDAEDQALEVGMTVLSLSLTARALRWGEQPDNWCQEAGWNLKLQAQGEERTNGAKMGDTYLMIC